MDDLIAEGRPGEAARVLEQHDQAEHAAALYEEAEQFQQALYMRVQLEHWDRVAELAFRCRSFFARPGEK